MDSKESENIAVTDAKAAAKGKAAEGAHPTADVAMKTKTQTRRGSKKGLAIVDLVLRLGASSAAVAAAYSPLSSEQILPFFTQFLQFHAEYNDLPTFTFFVVANAIAVGYIGLSMPFSIVCIIRPRAIGPRLLLVFCDTVMIALVVAAAGASSAIMYLAHNGNLDSNWLAICMQYTNFCQGLSGAVVASFVAAVFFMLLVVNSTFALKK
ncbi:putative casparian strip membrane protein [Rosa chinensis]|uniref:CASP-like protein n=1 Tax=Rosa chinensis TaxID=74649 RepID=A0A2P6QE48_ROSCH|nr:casparian strip membrane protein 2 [Rosa chinensis]PRQ32441.1 putative casparian strip membrane protein [Rosa chinensis]